MSGTHLSSDQAIDFAVFTLWITESRIFSAGYRGILASLCFEPIIINSVLLLFKVNLLYAIQFEMCSRSSFKLFVIVLISLLS